MAKIQTALLCTLMALGAESGLLVMPQVAVAQALKPALAQQLDDTQQEINDTEQEINFAKARRKASAQKLKAYEQDLEQKQNQLKIAQQHFEANHSAEEEQLLRNEEQRIALAELNIKSRMASVVRLESKEQELTEKLASLKVQLAALTGDAQLAKKAEPSAPAPKMDKVPQAQLLQQRLTTMQRENERLRQMFVAENTKREQAEERANGAEERMRAAELALLQYQKSTLSQTAANNDAPADDESLTARERAHAEMARVQKLVQANNADALNNVNLFLKGDDGTDYGMFQYLGAKQYRADAVIHSPISRFKVAGRTYQVKISEAGVGKEFIFLYDLSQSDAPRFVTFKKSLLEGQGTVAAE